LLDGVVEGAVGRHVLEHLAPCWTAQVSGQGYHLGNLAPCDVHARPEVSTWTRLSRPAARIAGDDSPASQALDEAVESRA
jgi:hypothetical protein